MIINECATKITIGIDASRNRSGGAVAHLIGILTEFSPSKHGVKSIHVWAFRSLLDQLPNFPWIVRHSPVALERSLFSQLMWQATALDSEARTAGCDILFSTDASTLCCFEPLVVLSQDMLSYEPKVMHYFGYGLARLRLIAILVIQNFAFRRAKGVIFLTQYAANVIQRSCGFLPSFVCIPHGVDTSFKLAKPSNVWPVVGGGRPISCIYVSNAAMYKHQWVVVEAISQLRMLGYNLMLNLIGGGQGRAQQLLQDAISVADPSGVFVKQFEFLPHEDLPALLAESDLFVFASSCENMPVTLVEAMAVGLPIACSNRGPMPEVLGNGGIYFDPEDAGSIADAIEQIIKSPSLRLSIAQNAKTLSQQYNWKRCADETFAFIVETSLRTKS
ncbi:glycosyltransferase family 4 protein [Polynucleobacter necessarius]|uniref:glycosyltransferase family 4 protein n=1 Tax=Polynucleobacter necessarius TaxID=576610 RepID=UPI000E091FE3|nr:glycosyltransferase family 1 protein [Polynucleobacter necessarius]